MWKRSELKAKAKVSFKRNYWKSVLISLIFAVFVSGGASIASSSSYRMGADDTGVSESTVEDKSVDDILSKADGMDASTKALYLVGFAIGVLIIFLMIMCIIILLDVFIFRPIEVGCDRYYIRNLNEPAQVGNIGYAFDNNYKNITKTMFFRQLFVFLWSLLLIIPGIVKAYEYQMIPYLLADNPQMTKEQAFAESKRMMKGQKWRAFVLDLSFIGWQILSLITCGIVGIFYVNPYLDATHAALYERLRYENQNTTYAAQ